MQTLEVTSKLLANATARDKINRFVQYYCRFLLWIGEKNGTSKDRLERLKGLMVIYNVSSKAAMACTRKAWRIGKQAEHAVNIKAALSGSDDIVKILNIVKSSGLSLWLVYDTLGFLHTQKVIKLQDSKTVSKLGNQYWLCALAASLLQNIYKLRWNGIRQVSSQSLIQAQERRIKKPLPVIENKEEYKKRLDKLASERSSLLTATVSDTLDILIPSINLEYIHLESGYAGLAGSITSLMGIWTILQPLLKN